MSIVPSSYYCLTFLRHAISQEIARRFHLEEQNRAKANKGGATQSPTHYPEDLVHSLATFVWMEREGGEGVSGWSE